MRHFSILFLCFCCVFILSCQPDTPPQNTGVQTENRILYLDKDTMRLVNADGSLVYEVRTNMRSGNILTIDDSFAYEGAYNRITAVNFKNGTNTYQKRYSFYSIEGSSPNWPVIDGDKLYFTVDNNAVKLNCLDKRTGNTIWEASENLGGLLSDGSFMPYYPTPSVSGDKVVVTQYNENLAGDLFYGVICYDKNTGTKLWSKLQGGYVQFGRLSNFSLIKDGKVYVVSTTYKKAYCLDLNTGNVLWTSQQFSLPVASMELYIHDNRLMITTGDYSSQKSAVNLLDLNTGAIVRTFDMPFGTMFQKEGNYLYTQGYSNSLMHKIDLVSGAVVWQKEIKYISYRRAVLADDAIYCIQTDNINGDNPILCLLSKETGDIIRKTKLKFKYSSGTKLSVIGKDGKVYQSTKWRN